MAVTHSTDTVYAFNGKTGTVHLEYSGPSNFLVAKRQLFPSSEPSFRGVNSQQFSILAPNVYAIEVPMVLGEVSQIGVWSDRSATHIAPEDIITYACLRAQNEAPVDFTDFTVIPGGTYCTIKSGGSTLPAGERYFVRMWIDKTETNVFDPKTRAFLSIAAWPNPPTLTKIIELVNKPLDGDVLLEPGTTYFYNYQIVTADGFSNIPKQLPLPSFATRARKVDVTIQQLRVTDDGDDTGTGEAEFRAAIFKNGVIVGVPWELGDDDNPIKDIEGRPSRPTVIAVNHSASIGPEPGDYKVGVNAHGREFDSFSDELASTGTQYALWDPYNIVFKTGPGEVNDANVKVTIPVPNVNQETFAFEIEVQYKVSYV